MDIRRVRTDEPEMWRELRLRMVTDSPMAFGESVEEAQAKSAGHWAEEVGTLATVDWATGMLAVEDGVVYGTVSLFRAPAPVLPREHVVILGRAYNSIPPDVHDEELLGPMLSTLARDMVTAHSKGLLVHAPIMGKAKLNMNDVIRVAMCACGPRDNVLEGWEWDSLILPTNENALLRWLWVDPVKRGTGVADTLMEAATSWSRSHGVKRMYLFVAETQLVALRFYLKMGYQLSNNRIGADPHKMVWINALMKDI